MDGEGTTRSPRLTPRAKIAVVAAVVIVAIAFLLQVRSILQPFLWAFLAAYLLTPIVNYLNVDGKLPRLWAVTLIYLTFGLLILGGSTYLYPRVIDQGTVFIEDIPRLEASLISLVGPRPLGIDIEQLVQQLLSAAGQSTTNTARASHLLVNAFETLLKLFLFLVATFYLLMDAPRLRSTLARIVPPSYRPEISALAKQINLTWKQYIRGELLLFALMATATSIGLTILQVPGAIFLGLVSGALELLPIIGPITAGTLAVSVAYFNGTNPWGWSQVAYAAAVAILYLGLRQAEDYFVVPNVLGRAVRLHPLVVLFAVTAGGIFGGLLGLVIAVPVAASVKAIGVYLYAKLLDQPVQFEPVRTIGGGIIEIPIHDPESEEPHNEAPVKEGAG